MLPGAGFVKLAIVRVIQSGHFGVFVQAGVIGLVSRVVMVGEL